MSMKYMLMGVLAICIVILINMNMTMNKREPFRDTSKKIGLCFLIYNKINHEELWYNWLKNVDKSKYTIYIHYKENKPLKYFEQYKLENCIETCWGCLSVVQAQNLMLTQALKDPQNKHFIWLSDSCIPIKSFNHVYDFLDDTKSYFNIAPDSQVFPRATSVLKFIEKDNIKKANMASILNRKHANILAQNETNINKWFQNINNVDEIVYITLLYHNGLKEELELTPNIAAGAIIVAQWSDMANYKIFEKSIKLNDYTYKYICPEELTYLIRSESLFCRKFLENCGGLDRLLDQL